MSHRDSKNCSSLNSQRDSSRHSRSHESSRENASSYSRERSPKDNELPQSFSRHSKPRITDHLNVVEKMSSFQGQPFATLKRACESGVEIKVWTRNFKEVRGIVSGVLKWFDKHWNLILYDSSEVRLKVTKGKHPYLEPEPNGKEIEEDVAIKQDDDDAIKQDDDDAMPTQEVDEKEGELEEQGKANEKKKKKKKRNRGNKKRTPPTDERDLHRLFIRGDNIVMLSTLYSNQRVRVKCEDEETLEE